MPDQRSVGVVLTKSSRQIHLNAVQWGCRTRSEEKEKHSPPVCLTGEPYSIHITVSCRILAVSSSSLGDNFYGSFPTTISSVLVGKFQCFFGRFGTFSTTKDFIQISR